MGKRFCRFTGGVIRLFSRRMRTEWEEPFTEGPCVFVVNYAGAVGPVDMCAKFPLLDRCHPWINAELEDTRNIPAYVRKACILPPVLKGLPYIPVYHDQRIMLTLRQSVRVLEKDGALVIFPEQPSGWLGHHEWINTGWLRLGEMWYRFSGRALKMYPVHIDREQRLFRVAAPVRYDPARRFREQEKELAEQLARGMAGRK